LIRAFGHTVSFSCI